MSAPFSDYIKLIGKGQKSSKTLTREQAYQAMSMVLDGKVSQDQRGAFLMLLRLREETAEEIAGFTDACRERVIELPTQQAIDLDIGCYAGKRRHLPWYLLAVACLVKAGYRVFLHGTKEWQSKRFYASDVLPRLGLTTCHSAQQICGSLDSRGVAYAELSLIHPKLDTLIQLREEFGLRSCANTLGRLLNPSQAVNMIQGVHHEHVDIRHGVVNSFYPEINSLCFRGDGGDPEVNPDKATNLILTRKGVTEELCVNSDLDGWSIKDKMDQPDVMILLWQDQAPHTYGESAVLASLTAYLMLLESLTEHQAQQKAQTLWQSRDVNGLPFASLA